MRTINQQIKEAESAFRMAGAGVDNFKKTIAGTESRLSLSPKHPHLALVNGMLFRKGENRLVCYPFDSPAGTCAAPDSIGAAFANDNQMPFVYAETAPAP
jgi:hypothetical protein